MMICKCVSDIWDNSFLQDLVQGNETTEKEQDLIYSYTRAGESDGVDDMEEDSIDPPSMSFIQGGSPGSGRCTRVPIIIQQGTYILRKPCRLAHQLTLYYSLSSLNTY